MLIHGLDTTSHITLGILLGILAWWLYKKHTTYVLPARPGQVTVPTEETGNDSRVPTDAVRFAPVEHPISAQPAGEWPGPDTVLREQVYAMADEGLPCVEIARSLQTSRGAVQLLLTLRAHAQHRRLP